MFLRNLGEVKVLVKHKSVVDVDDHFDKLGRAVVVTPDMMQREKRCVVSYNSTSRNELERFEIKRLLDNRRLHGVPEYEFGAGAGRNRRKLGSIYDD